METYLGWVIIAIDDNYNNEENMIDKYLRLSRSDRRCIGFAAVSNHHLHECHGHHQLQLKWQENIGVKLIF